MVTGIPDKHFFRIGEAANIVSVRPSVLRYWETEFEALKPSKSRTGQRLYTKKEVELLFDIKRLLYAEKLTIEGAKKKLSVRKRKSEDLWMTDRIIEVIREIREELLELKNSL